MHILRQLRVQKGNPRRPSLPFSLCFALVVCSFARPLVASGRFSRHTYLVYSARIAAFALTPSVAPSPRSRAVATLSPSMLHHARRRRPPTSSSSQWNREALIIIDSTWRYEHASMMRSPELRSCSRHRRRYQWRRLITAAARHRPASAAGHCPLPVPVVPDRHRGRAHIEAEQRSPHDCTQTRSIGVAGPLRAASIQHIVHIRCTLDITTTNNNKP